MIGGKMATVKIKRDTKRFDRRRREWKHLQDFNIEVGWDGVQHPTGVSAAQLVQWLEEGHINKGWFEGTKTPPRPFIRTMFMPRAKALVDDLVPTYVHRVFEGPKNNMMAYYLKEKLRNVMKQVIHEYSKVPNTPTTAGLKGKNDPLVETGFIAENVKAEIALSKSYYLRKKSGEV